MKNNNPRRLVKYEIHYYHEGRFVDGVKMGEADSLILPPVEKRREFYVAEVIVEELPTDYLDEWLTAARTALVKFSEAFDDEEGIFADDVNDVFQALEHDFVNGSLYPVVKHREGGENGYFTKIEEFPDSFHYAFWSDNDDDYYGWNGYEEWADRMDPDDWNTLFGDEFDPPTPPWESYWETSDGWKEIRVDVRAYMEEMKNER